MRSLSRISLVPLLLVLSGACTRSDRDEAKDRARRIEEQAKREARKIRDEAKHTASEISDKTNSALDRAHVQGNGASESAREKLRAGAHDMRRDLDKAGTAIGEASLTAQVKSRLATDAGLRLATGVEVHTSGSVVTLEGSVDTADQKQAAERAAASISGVSRVVNKLRVEKN